MRDSFKQGAGWCGQQCRTRVAFIKCGIAIVAVLVIGALVLFK